MALTTTVHDSLPYIDTDPTPTERAAAQALIDALLPPTTEEQQPHPSLPALLPESFSPIYALELERISTSTPLTGIDLTRYEAAETSTTNTTSLRASLSQAYTSHAYLRMRESNMHLLDQFGRNSWLVGNSQVEDVLRSLERELADTKQKIDVVVVERKSAQEAVAGEVKGLEEAWRGGVGRVLETEVAAEGVRREVLGRRREGGI